MKRRLIMNHVKSNGNGKAVREYVNPLLPASKKVDKKVELIKGMNRDMGSMRIELVREAPIKKCQLLTPEDVCNLLHERVRKLDREHFFVIPLTGKNQVIGINLVSMGSLTDSIAHPREVFKAAILANAASVILAHNHPSGDPTPSQDDKAITIRLKQAGDILGIKVNDHIILGEGKAYYSFLENIDALLQAASVSTIVTHERHTMPSIKKVIGKDER